MFRGIATVSIYADDVPTARDWYAEVLQQSAYFAMPEAPAVPEYVEFRVGDHEDELGIINRRHLPAGASQHPGGAVVFWHVDDLTATLERLLSLGATTYEPMMERGSGFRTASVIDPFGNILGVMTNPHFLEMIAPGTE